MFNGKMRTVPFIFGAEFFISPTAPEHAFARFGRIVCVLTGTTAEARQYRMNTEYVFLPFDTQLSGIGASLTLTPDLADFEAGFKLAAASMLNNMGYQPIVIQASADVISDAKRLHESIFAQ